ncbi:MAG: hypothetical protein IMX03_01210 [Brockia lithotrophica]|nr:hypothetical protein [Brockia lithotrophica]
MSWAMYRWVWQLEAPLHVGMPPAGQLNRTRLYVPARTLWGALTAELARRQASSAHGVPVYKEVGDKLRKKARLSYLFPAQRVDQSWRAWLPIYEFGKGLLWRREDRGREDREGKDNQIKEREFRRWLLTTRAGTGIDPNSDTVSEGALRENEVVNQWSFWDEKQGDFLPVYFVGYIFLSDDVDDTVKSVLDIEDLFIGGDTRYGLGRVRRVPQEEVREGLFYDRSVDLQNNNPVVQSDCVWAHASIGDSRMNPLYGAWEMLVGWDNGQLRTNELAWVPGSRVDREVKWSIREDGLWEKLS